MKAGDDCVDASFILILMKTCQLTLVVAVQSQYFRLT